MPENEELTDFPAFEVEAPQDVELNDETEDTEAGDDSPTDSDTTAPDEPDEPNDDALDDAAILRLMKRGKWAQTQQQEQYQPVEEPEVPDPLIDPVGYAQWVKSEVQKENEPSLRPYLGASIEKNVREAIKKAKIELPEEAFELLRSQAETFPMDALRANATPDAARLIAFNLMESFEPVQKPKAKPIGASVTSGLESAAPSAKTIQLRGEDADAWRSWSADFGDSASSRQRFLKALGKNK